MKRILGAGLVAGAVLALSGCSPAVTYRKAELSDNPSDPAKDQVVFALQQSAFLLNPLASPDNKAAGGGKPPMPATTPCDATDGSLSAWSTCLDKAVLAVAPQVDPSAIYIATVLHGVALEVTPVDSAPLLPARVAQTYSNPTAKTVTTIGEDAVAGYAIAGPFGALGGGVLGVLGTAFAAEYRFSHCDGLVAECSNAPVPAARPVKLEQDLDHLCQVPRTDHLPNAPLLHLPVRLDALVARSDTTGGPAVLQHCWTQFPQLDASDGNAGWLYRIDDETPPTEQRALSIPPVFYVRTDSPAQLPPPFVTSAAFFAVNTSKSQWPASACRGVILKVVWWKNLVAARGKANGPAEKAYAVQVADPNILQLTTLTKDGRTITAGTTCGVYATNKAPADNGSAMSALLKEGAALSQAAQAYAKTQTASKK
jgi:hypothetical protein